MTSRGVALANNRGMFTLGGENKMKKLLVVAASAGAVLFGSQAGTALATVAPCDGTDMGACLLPYPNDHFTKKNSKTATKLQLNLPASGMPATKAGKKINATQWNQLDGFSPGSTLIASATCLDPTRSNINGVTNPGGYASANAGAIVFDIKSPTHRWPIFGEIDSQADTRSQADLLIRPLVNFTEGHTYVVVLRNIKDSSGAACTPSTHFKGLRDSNAKGEVMKRVSEYAPIFKAIKTAGIDRKSVFLAWKFTVASSKSLAGRLLSMRDQAFKALGDTNLKDRVVSGRSPAFTITSVENYTSEENPYLIRRVYGTIDTPCFLKLNGCGAGSFLNLDSKGLPKQTAGSNIDHAPFVCNIPRSVSNGTTVLQKAFSVLYGHGLLGSYRAITGNSAYAIGGNDYGNVFCGLDWQGMSSNDVNWIGLGILPDLSNFGTLPDRLQQAHLNYLLLARALIHPSGLGANAAFKFGGATSLGTKVGFSGDSQGGILGGTTMAVSPDFKNGSLGVPGINYSTLLDRSVDWPEYAAIMYNSYSKGNERPLLMALIQQLWDRGEADGYAQHIGRNPLPNTPVNSVLLLPAFGDHQVTNLAAEVYARTINAKLRTPALTVGRGNPFQMFWGITDGGASSFSGNAMLMMDSGPCRPSLIVCTLGTPAPPTTNLPPPIGNDPHGLGGGAVEIRRLVSAYIRTGSLPSSCSGLPCGIGEWVPGL